MNKTATGKQGFGFWNTTHYPIGGCFCRFAQNETITNIAKLDRPHQGATHTGKMVRDGKELTIAFNILSVDQEDNQESVIRANIIKEIIRMVKSGTTGASIECLFQCTTTKGVTVPVGSYRRLFEEVARGSDVINRFLTN